MMEEENRNQKLRAGKEKLAQFQRKKKKKKSVTNTVAPQNDEDHQTAASNTPPVSHGLDTEFVIDEELETGSSVSEEDTDSALESSSKASIQLTAKLREKSQRVEELEESLLGKQLALDKVVKENEKLKLLMKHVEDSDKSHNAVTTTTGQAEQNGTDSKCAEAGTQSSFDNQSLTDAVNQTTHPTSEIGDPSINGTCSQEFSMTDVQELLHHVQWLQIQLKQANSTLQTQNNKQRETAVALQHAKDEIVLLQENITQKDQLLNELVEKISQISKEYSALKQNYAKLSEAKNKEIVREEVKQFEDIQEILKSALKQKEEEIQNLSDIHEVKLSEINCEFETKVRNLQSELEAVRLENEDCKIKNEKLSNETQGLKEYCDTLTKGLEFMKAEHEKVAAELSELSDGTKTLRTDYDSLVEEKVESELLAESLQSEIQKLATERDIMVNRMKETESLNEDLQLQMNGINETLEEMKSEREHLLHDNTVLADELSKLKEDNTMYQNQIQEYERKMCESEEILGENHSLHIHNDDLNNKINNQKDIIASLKNELEVLSQQNNQLVEQVNSVAVSFEEVKLETGCLKDERNQLVNDISLLKEQLKQLTLENEEYKENQVSLNGEIKHLQNCLMESKSDAPVEVPKIESTVLKTLNSGITRNAEEKQDDMTSHKGSTLLSLEPLPQLDNIVGIETLSEVETSEVENPIPVDDLVMTDSDSMLYASSAITVSVQNPQNVPIKDISKLQNEIARLQSVIIELQAARITEKVVDGAKAAVLNEESSQSVTQDQNATTTKEILHTTCDTAYNSLQVDPSFGQFEDKSAELEALSEKNAILQEDLNEARQKLDQKSEECEHLREEMKLLKQEKAGITQNLHSEFQKSDFENAAENNSEDIGTTNRRGQDNGDSDDNQQYLMPEQPDTSKTRDSDSLDERLMQDNCELKKLTKQLQANVKFLDSEVQSRDETVFLMKQCVKNLENSNSELQSKLNDLCEIIHKNEEKIQDLAYENEKLSWERNEMNKGLSALEKENLEIKSAKSDMEFQKIQYEEDLQRVKERLDYLESSDNDIIEIKSLLEEVQEDRENTLKENERLQCTLSAKFEENEKLMETLECLHKENASTFENLRLTNTKIEQLSKELENTKLKCEKQSKVIEVLKEEKTSIEEKFEGEIEGLLQENSTLKTCVQMKNTELETMKIEIDRLNSFFPNIDEQAEKNFKLLSQNAELECKIKELENDNESMMKELSETLTQLENWKGENEMLEEKCDEFQKIINELDEEKTLLLELTDRTKEEFTDKLKENEVLIEKYEMHLELLDQENSTLKTQLSGLKLEVEGLKQKGLGQDNSLEGKSKDEHESNTYLEEENKLLQAELEENKSKVLELEQDLLGLVEQVQLYDETVSEKEDIATKLEKEVEELITEAQQLREKCSSFESDLREAKLKENYLKEQMEIYEKSINLEDERNDIEVERLTAQLELEKKYKSKYEKDLEFAHTELGNFERENLELKEMNKLLEKDIKAMKSKQTETEQQLIDMNDQYENICQGKAELESANTELGKQIKEISKVNENLQSEVSTFQNHLHAVSENRNHVRAQVEVLASEIERLNDDRDSLENQYNKLSIFCTNLNLRKSELCIKAVTLSEEKRQLKLENEALLEQIEKLRGSQVKENTAEEFKHVIEENERLVQENLLLQTQVKQFKLNSDSADALLVDNEMLQNEIEVLKARNNVLKSSIETLKDKLNKVDDLIERNRAAELDNDSLAERLDVLHSRLGEIQTEKEALQTMTEELTTMLHEMQTKYEEVKSEMETTKKKCDKEISHLQNQLHEMNEDVSELRKMLDYMENEMHSASEEKNVLKENLEEQQNQFAEVVEQKQKLEEILSDKQQKDLKNMQMATQKQKNRSTTVTVLQDMPNNDYNLPCDIAVTDGASASASNLEPFRDSMDSDFSDIVPSFASAFHLFGLGSSEDSDQQNKFVQTNISIKEFENCGTLLDDNGGINEHLKDESKHECETQTDVISDFDNLVCEVLQGINIPGKLVEDIPVDEFANDESSEISEDEFETAVEYNLGIVDSQYLAQSKGKKTLSINNESVVEMLPTQMEADLVQTFERAVEVETKSHSVSCQMDLKVKGVKPVSKQAEYLDEFDSVQDFGAQCVIEMLSTQSQTEDISSVNTSKYDLDAEDTSRDLDFIVGNISLMSTDSGILSACPLGETQPQPFIFPAMSAQGSFGSNSDALTAFNTFECDQSVVISMEDRDPQKEQGRDRLLDAQNQTELELFDDFERKLKENVASIETEFTKKLHEREIEIENMVVQKLNIREHTLRLKEDSYEQRIKQAEYDIEEKYAEKLRMREVEIMLEAEKSKKKHAVEVQSAADRKIENIKKEKDQQFVETLQKVRADFTKRYCKESGEPRQTVSNDFTTRQVGPDGDVASDVEEHTLEKLELENQELASARDVLLQKINITQQEQEDLCQELQSIMGEQRTMGNRKPTSQQMPSWIDWELSPELSYGSIRSSVGSKNLSESLDTPSYCSNSDCRHMKMKYEHLIERIQQFLQIKAAEEMVDPEKDEPTSIEAAFESSNTEKSRDRFIENEEHESQMLERLTSIHLEHFVRVPHSESEDPDDQFVQEEEVHNQESITELNNDIISMLVRDSLNLDTADNNEDGHFSINEPEDENIRDEIDNRSVDQSEERDAGVTDSRIPPFSQCRSSVSFMEDDGHFSSEDENCPSLGMKRHFSESDVSKILETSGRIKTSNSDNMDGHFEIETLNTICKVVERKAFSQQFEDNVFMETVNIQSNSSKVGMEICPKRQTAESSDFVHEHVSLDDRPPGEEGFVVITKSEPRTGEESGDFFEEKLMKPLSHKEFSLKEFDQTRSISHHKKAANKETNSLHFSSKKSQEMEPMRKVAVCSDREKVFEQVDTDEPQNTDADLSPVQKEYVIGQHSYENTVFDILNSICPGTDPSRRRQSTPPEIAMHPVIRELENTTTDYSDLPIENDLRNIVAECEYLKINNDSLTKENNELKKVMKVKDLESQNDIEVLVEKVTELDELKEQHKRDDKELQKLIETNQELAREVNQLQNQISIFESENMKQTEYQGSLEEQLKELLIEQEKWKHVEKQSKELLPNCNEASSTTEQKENKLRTLQDESLKILAQNQTLQVIRQQHDYLIKSKTTMQSKLLELENNIVDLCKQLDKQHMEFQKQKYELEQALFAQADKYDTLLHKSEKIEAENNKLKTVFEHEKSKFFELERSEIELKTELLSLKSEKNEVNETLAKLLFENENLKCDISQTNKSINNLKEEKHVLNEKLVSLERKFEDNEQNINVKDSIIAELMHSKEILTKDISELQAVGETLNSNLKTTSEQLSAACKEIETLKCVEEKRNALIEDGEKLKDELIETKKIIEEKEWSVRKLREQVEKLEKDKLQNITTSHTDASTSVPELNDHQLSNDAGLREDLKSHISLTPAFEVEDNKEICSIVQLENIADNDRLNTEIAQLKEELDLINSEYRSLKEMTESYDVEGLKSENLTLKLENETLKRSIDQTISKADSETDLYILEDMKDALKSMQEENSSAEKHKQEAFINIEKENKRLTNEIEELYVENDQLKVKLKTREEMARKENGEILKMYSDLRNEVEVLVISKHDLEVELHVLKDLLEQDPYPHREKSEQDKNEHDTSRELTLQDLEEMEELKTSIEQLKSDLKEKDSYVRKLEEHLLNVDSTLPILASTPKPSSSRGVPFMSKSFLKKRQSFTSFSRKAFSHDLPNSLKQSEKSVRKIDFERSQTLDSSVNVADYESSQSTPNTDNDLQVKTSSADSESACKSVSTGCLQESDRIVSGLNAGEDGHLALELKQFELVAEITKLRRDFRETKAVYAKETALLSEALEKEKLANELRSMSDHFGHSIGSNLSHDVLKLRTEVARLKEENKLLNIDCERWIERLEEQEEIVAELKERLGRNTSGYGEIEEVFGRQLALLQKQREELMDKLKDKQSENSALSETLGAKNVLEETLRQEKEVLLAKLKEKENVEQELNDKKLMLEKQIIKQKELEDIVYQKDINEIELMKEKRILEEELREIESKFRDKEENLDYEKNKLLDELKQKRIRTIKSRFSESDDEVSSVCSESAAFSDRNIGRLEIMLEEVEKQHSKAVSVLRDQLHEKYSRREKELRKEHASSLSRLKKETIKQVT